MTTLDDPSVSYRLHAAVTRADSLQESLSLITAAACDAIDGCRSSGLSRRGTDRPRTVASSGPFATRLDHAQFDDRRGPSVQALAENEAVVVERIADHRDEWPSFVRRAEELGVRSSLSMPLVVEDGPFAALNLYACEESTFTTATVAFAEILAAEAALAVHTADAFWESRTLVDHLHRALESRDRIGQAKGVLMAQLGITSDQAFEVMRGASHRRSMKLRDVADRVTLTGELPD